MIDPEFEAVRSKAQQLPAGCAPHRKLWWTLACLVVLWLMGCTIEPRRRYTCAVCRLDRIDGGFLGYRWSNYEESECSRWYTAHVEPIHGHAWAGRSRCRRFGIPGIYGGYACFVGPPITGLSKSFQLQLYERFRDPLEAKSLFIRLGQGDAESLSLIEGLSEWMDSGASEPWDEWWRKRGSIRDASNDGKKSRGG